MSGARAALALLLGLPFAAPALEPRFDHRDEHGPVVEALYAYDTVAISGRPTRSAWRPALRVAWGFDASGEGDELLLGVTTALKSFDDPDRDGVLLGADLRYRAYFGDDELKTFFDVGLWAPLVSRVGVGPLVGMGLAWDFSRMSGVYAAGGFSTAFGGARIASFSGAAGFQLRFD